MQMKDSCLTIQMPLRNHRGVQPHRVQVTLTHAVFAERFCVDVLASFQRVE
jgi:hypothetical protein